MTTIQDVSIRVGPHKMLNICYDLLYVTAEEIAKEMASQGVISCCTLQRKQNGEMINTTSVVLTFSRDRFPEKTDPCTEKPKDLKGKAKFVEKKSVSSVCPETTPESKVPKSNKAPPKPAGKAEMGGKSITVPPAASMELRQSMEDELDEKRLFLYNRGKRREDEASTIASHGNPLTKEILNLYGDGMGTSKLLAYMLDNLTEDITLCAT
ncbi:hypothetical protein J437_LFUL015785, partial [Ladona fulva]